MNNNIFAFHPLHISINSYNQSNYNKIKDRINTRYFQKATKSDIKGLLNPRSGAKDALLI